MNTTTWRITRDEAVAEHGMVAAKHPLAAEAGLGVLRDGGNAIDAAITTALAMAVVDPAMCGIGGGGILVYYEARTGCSTVINFWVQAPQAATPDMYAIVEPGKVDNLGFRGVRNDENIYGHRSVAVPGMLAGMAMALEQFGTINLSQALQPAIRFAADGIPATWYSMLIAANSQDRLARYPVTAAIFLRDGQYIQRAGEDRLIQTDLARTLERVAADGLAGFYRGSVAEAIVVELESHGNPITLTDLADYRPRMMAPRFITYRDRYQLLYAPMSGGSTLAETFNILEGFDLAGQALRNPDTLHLFIEASRIAYADRWRHLADEAYVDVPWPVLESKEYAAERRRAIQPNRAVKTWAPWAGGAWTAGQPEAEGCCTTHLSVVDRDRNMVALTQTHGLGWGSGVVAPGTGVLFNDLMVLFDPNPGRANSIQGGKRPLSSMTPVLVLRDGQPYLTVGAPGGRMIMGTVMNVLQHVLDNGLGIQAACASLAVDANADQVMLDAALGPDVADALRARGHAIDVREKMFMPRPFASPTGILIDPATGYLHGGADPFHPGIAIGY